MLIIIFSVVNIYKYEHICSIMGYNDFQPTDMDSEINKISKINAAGLINVTLEQLWQSSFRNQRNGKHWSWNRDLDAIWTILGGDCKQGGEEEKKFDEINIRIGNAGSLNHIKSGFETIGTDDLKRMATQYKLLMEKSLFLRRLQNNQGKGTAYVEEEDDWE